MCVCVKENIARAKCRSGDLGLADAHAAAAVIARMMRIYYGMALHMVSFTEYFLCRRDGICY